MATDNSTAAPKLRELSASMDGSPLPANITLHRMRVSTNSAAMAAVLIFPRFLIPIKSHTRIRPPITRHQTHRPALKIPLAASPPS